MQSTSKQSDPSRGLHADRADWKVGQRVARANGDELGLVVDVSATVKVKWDGGGTSYYHPEHPGNVKPSP